MPKLSVSISKLSSFLKEKNYSIIALYVCDNNIRFIEAKTPKFQRSFMIYVSQKFSMKPSANTNLIEIHLLSESNRQLDYLSKVNENFIDCDLTSVSSKYICTNRDGEGELYSMGSVDDDDHHPEIEEKTDRPSEGIIKKAMTVFDNMNIPLNANVQKEVLPSESDTTGEIDLIFEDGEGQSVEDVADFAETFIEEPENSGLSDSEVADDSGIDQETTLGIIYYTLDLSSLYKTIEGLEERIIDVYDIIDSNIDVLRGQRVLEIEELTKVLLSKVSEMYEKYQLEEGSLKNELERLSSIFDQTANIKSKINNNMKYTKNKKDIDNVYNETKKTIHDTNMSVIKIKDDFDDFLDRVYITIKELIENA
jgi:hypothetical protein